MTLRAFALGAAVAAVLAGLTLPAQALDRRVRIVNETGFTIVRFYGSNKGSDSWEEDILGNDVLRSCQSVVNNFNANTVYCIFDSGPSSRMATCRKRPA